MYCQERSHHHITINKHYSFIILSRVYEWKPLGSHICENGIINYFDSLACLLFKKYVNHAKRTNMTLLHQSDQIQNLLTTTCGYFCLYFLNEMSKGRSYYDLLKVFNSHNTMENEKYIENYFKII